MVLMDRESFYSSEEGMTGGTVVHNGLGECEMQGQVSGRAVIGAALEHWGRC